MTDDRTFQQMDAAGVPVPKEEEELQQRLREHQIQLERLRGIVSELVQHLRSQPAAAAPSSGRANGATNCDLSHSTPRVPTRVL